GREQRQLLQNYAAAWGRGDFHRMYTMLSPSSRARISESVFRSELEHDADIATTTALRRTRLISTSDDNPRFHSSVMPRAFGTLQGVLELPFEGSGNSTRIRFEPKVLFPGLRSGETLTREDKLAPRGTILAADGTPLAVGPSRSSPIPSVAS